MRGKIDAEKVSRDVTKMQKLRNYCLMSVHSPMLLFLFISFVAVLQSTLFLSHFLLLSDVISSFFPHLPIHFVQRKHNGGLIFHNIHLSIKLPLISLSHFLRASLFEWACGWVRWAKEITTTSIIKITTTTTSDNRRLVSRALSYKENAHTVRDKCTILKKIETHTHFNVFSIQVWSVRHDADIVQEICPLLFVCRS